MAITREDLDNLRITKERMQEITLDELQGKVFDTRNELQARKWNSVDRSGLDGTITEVLNMNLASEITYGEADNIGWGGADSGFVRVVENIAYGNPPNNRNLNQAWEDVVRS